LHKCSADLFQPLCRVFLPSDSIPVGLPQAFQQETAHKHALWFLTLPFEADIVAEKPHGYKNIIQLVKAYCIHCNFTTCWGIEPETMSNRL
jgi:hypothetical protein